MENLLCPLKVRATIEVDSEGKRWANVKEFEACRTGRYEVREYMGSQIIHCDGEYAQIEEITTTKKTPNLSHSVPLPGPSLASETLTSSQVRVVDFQGHESFEVVKEKELPILENEVVSLVSSSELSLHEKIFVYLAMLVQPTLLAGFEVYFGLSGVLALFVGSCLAVTITRPSSRSLVSWRRDAVGLSCVILTFWSSVRSAMDFFSLAVWMVIITFSCSLFQRYVLNAQYKKPDIFIFLGSIFFLWVLRLCCSAPTEHWWGLPFVLSTYPYYFYLIYLEKPYSILYRLPPLSRFSKLSQSS